MRLSLPVRGSSGYIGGGPGFIGGGGSPVSVHSPQSIRSGTVSINVADATHSIGSGTVNFNVVDAHRPNGRARTQTFDVGTRTVSFADSPTAQLSTPVLIPNLDRRRANSGYSSESSKSPTGSTGTPTAKNQGRPSYKHAATATFDVPQPVVRARARAQTMGGPMPDPFGLSPAAQPSDATYSGSLPTFCGKPYQPGPRSVLVIGPGGGTRMNAPAYQVLEQSGWDISVAMAPEYDRSPAYPDFLYPPGWENGTPDLSMNGGKNLATLADNVILPMIEQLIAQGRGPAAIICGSRGGHVSLPRLWASRGWLGPTLCINGGCIKFQVPGAPCRLILITGGQDYFETKDPRATAQMLKKEDPSHPVLVYHDHKEGHMPGSMGDVFGPLLEIAINEESFLSTAQAAAQGQHFLPQPQARRHNVPLRAL